MMWVVTIWKDAVNSNSLTLMIRNFNDEIFNDSVHDELDYHFCEYKNSNTIKTLAPSS